MNILEKLISKGFVLFRTSKKNGVNVNKYMFVRLKLNVYDL